ncbi:hypothetical protein B0H21DRAFT_506571 [Amylocystis lapponica]|nr:hypothetical protein B0H21DRAFT_506571 [Amylocystis lapponica]
MNDQPEHSVNNPYFAPLDGRCFINELPTELLSHIFLMGVQESDDDDSDDGDDDDSTDSESGELGVDSGGSLTGEDDDHVSVGAPSGSSSESDIGDPPAFELLVSHVCCRWRAIALQTPALWANITFAAEDEGNDYALAREYLERSKTVPISISVDFTVDDDDSELILNMGVETIKTIMECIIPHLSHWRSFEAMVSVYDLMNAILVKLGDCDGAPLLEVLELYHHHEDEDDDYDRFRPECFKEQPFVLFGGDVPRLTHVALWGVHLDWTRSRFLSGLTDLELAYHAENVRPSYADFARILRTSPELTTLSICTSGPAGGPVEWFESLQKADGNEVEMPTSSSAVVTTTLTLDSVKELVLAYHEYEYIMPLLDRLALPNLTSLALDMDQSDFTEFLRALARPAPTTGKPLLSGLTSLKVTGMLCNRLRVIAEVYAAAPNLTSLNLDFNFLDHRWYQLLLNLETTFLLEPDEDMLLDDIRPIPPEKMYLPRLETLTTSGLDGALMCKLVEVRRELGAPLKRVLMEQGDNVGEYEHWLRTNVEEFKLFEGSDTESMDSVDGEDSDESDGFDEDSDEDPNDRWKYGVGDDIFPEGEDSEDDADSSWEDVD